MSPPRRSWRGCHLYRCRCPLLSSLSCSLRGWIYIYIFQNLAGYRWALQDNASWNHESIDCSSLAPGPAQLGKAHWGSRFLVAGLYWSTLTDPPACARVWASRRSDIAAFRLHTALLTTTWLVVDWLILLDWLLVIDWWCSQSSAALFRASGNRYFPFLYGRWYSPHQVQGSRIQYGLFVLDPRLPPGVRCLGAILPFCCWNVALLLLVQSPRQRPKSGPIRYFLLHTTPSLCHLSLHSPSLSIL